MLCGDSKNQNKQKDVVELQKLTAIANMLPPLNFVGSDRCCAVQHVIEIVMTISDVKKIALVLRRV